MVYLTRSLSAPVGCYIPQNSPHRGLESSTIEPNVLAPKSGSEENSNAIRNKGWMINPVSKGELDALNVSDITYLKHIDCSIKEVLAVALQNDCCFYKLDQPQVEICERFVSPISSVIWSPSGSFLGIARQTYPYLNPIVQIWDAVKGSVIHRAGISREGTRETFFEPLPVAWQNDQVLISAYKNDVVRGDRRCCNSERILTTSEQVYSLRWASSQSKLAAGLNKATTVFDYRKMEKDHCLMLAEFKQEGVINALEWGASDLLIAGGMGGLDLYNIAENKKVWSLGGIGFVSDILWPNRSTIIVAQGGPWMGGAIHIVDPDAPQTLASFGQGLGRLLSLAHCSSQDEFYSISSSQTLSIWDYPFPDANLRNQGP